MPCCIKYELCFILLHVAPLEVMVSHWSIPSTPSAEVSSPANPNSVVNQSVMWKKLNRLRKKHYENNIEETNTY